MDWASVIENPLLRDLPFKIELNKFGQILMSPASNKHGRIQSRTVVALAKHQPTGEVITECSVETSDGVKVADVAWASDAFVERFGYRTPYPQAPEICIELISPSNTRAEIDHKIALYLEANAQEVWIIDADERVTVYDADGPRSGSRVVPKFALGSQ